MKARSTVKPKRPKRRRRHTANHKRVVIVILMLLLCGALGAVALTSPYLYVKKTQVLGVKTIATNDILERAHIGNASNILRIRKGAITARVKTNPVVREVKIYRRLPDTVILRVQERKPVYLLDTGSAKFIVDMTGIPFRRVKGTVAGLPVIAYSMPKPPVLGKPIRAEGFTAAMESFRLVKQRNIEGVGKITVDQSSYLCLNISEGFVVKLGRPEHLAEKIGIAAQTMKRIPDLAEHGEYLDITCLEAPAVKMKD